MTETERVRREGIDHKDHDRLNYDNGIKFHLHKRLVISWDSTVVWQKLKVKFIRRGKLKQIL